MALPVNVDTCTVAGTFVYADGSVPTGTVEFTPHPCLLADASATPPTTILSAPIVATLVSGAIELELPATDDLDLNPSEWTYHVRVRLNGNGPGVVYSFDMAAPGGETIDLADVTPVSSSDGVAIIVGPAGSPGDDGPAGVGVPAGGATGEVLAKLSSADFDSDWVPASAPGVHGSTHAAGSTDPVTVTEAQVTGLVADLAAKQPLDADLTVIAALSPGSDTIIQRKVGMWVASTPTEYKTDLALTKSDVGLGNVTNTSDTNKPVSTAQQTALDLKADKTITFTPTAPLAGGGSLAANRTLTVATFDDDSSGVVPLSGGGTTNFLRADGTWAQPPGAGGVGANVSFTFNAGTTEPPTGNQLRINNASQTAATRMWISQTTTDGLDVTVGLAKIKAGHQIYFQDRDDASKWVKYSVTADGVDDGTYWDFAVAYLSGPANVPFQTIQLQPVAPGTVGVPPGGTTGQVLAKESTADYAVEWVDQTGGGGGGITTEDAVDAVATALTEGTGIDLAYDDGAGTITVTVDKTEMSLTKSDVGLSNVDNTADTAKPISTATQTALDLKASTTALSSHETDTTAIHGIADTAQLETTTGAQTKVDTHVNDTTAAHAATAIGYAGSTNLVATTVEAALDELDAEKQPLDTDLTTIAGLTATTDNMIQSVSSAWASRTPAQVKTALALDQVTNTADTAKPVSTAQQTALDLKVDKSVTINAQTGTTYTLVLTDASKLVTLSNASAITLSVPTNVSVAFPTGTRIDLTRLGAGSLTVVAVTPGTTTVNATPSLVFRAQYSAASLIKYATDTWLLVGDLATP